MDRCAPFLSGIMCSMCPTKFASVTLLNRHNKRMHGIITSIPRKRRIICPLCEEKHELKSHEILRNHLEGKHAVNIERLTLKFPSLQEYESWKTKEKIDTGYAMYNSSRYSDHKEINYICNRSDSRGYRPKHQERREKSGGTIRIQGMCPSRLRCKFYDNGIVFMAFWKTHVGHERELRSLHLSKAEQEFIIDKFKSGVSIDRILEDARNLKGPEPLRINLITRDHIVYLIKKHKNNIKRECNEMVTAESKVQEKSMNRKNAGIFCKQPDDVAKALGENSFIQLREEIEIVQLEDQDRREAEWTTFKNWAESLNDEVFNKFMDNIQGEIRKVNHASRLSNKRKMGTQQCLPAIKQEK